MNLDDLLQPVVSVDDASVEVVEVGGREPATVELDHRSKLGGDDGDDVEDHPLGAAAGVDEGFGDFQSLDGAGAALTGGHDDLLAEFASKSVQLDAAEEFLHRFGADVGADEGAEVLA